MKWIAIVLTMCLLSGCAVGEFLICGDRGMQEWPDKCYE